MIEIGRMTGRDIQNMRGYYGLTQQQLAERLGVNRSVVAQWEIDRFSPPPYLSKAIQQIGYQVIRERNQPIIEAHIVQNDDMEGYRSVLKALGLFNEYPDFPMFDANGVLVYWYVPNRDGYFALGEATKNVNGKWRGYIIPQNAEPKPELRLPTLMESPY